MGVARGPHTCPGLWDRRVGHWLDAADSRCAGCKGCRGWDDGRITLGRRIFGSADHALSCEGIDVLVENTGDGWVCRVETVRHVLQGDHEQVLFGIRQLEVTDGHIFVVRDLGLRPAGHPFHRSRRAVSRRDGSPKSNRKRVARVVEMDELLQAFDVAIVKELLLEVRYRIPVRVELAGLGGRTLWRCN